jgi:hypothetical protein
MNTLIRSSPFAKHTYITVAGSVSLTALGRPAAERTDGQAGVAKGGDAGIAALIVAAVLLVAALRQLRKSLAPVAEVVHMVMAAVVAAALVLAAFILVLVSAVTLG